MSGSWRWLALLGVVAALAVVIAGRPSAPDDDEPYSPESTEGSGARALVLLLEELGAEVDATEGVPDGDATTAVLLDDQLGGDRAEGVLDWVEGGGTLVVADAGSPFVPVATGPVEGSEDDRDVIAAGRCDIEALAGVERLAPPEGLVFEAPTGSRTCFGDGVQAFVVEEDRGAGRLVSIGSQAPFVNTHLDAVDNAVLVAQLLAPEPDEATVTFLVRDPDPAPAPQDDGRPGEGGTSLSDLIPNRVLLALLQLALAFAAYVWFRARRVGKPVVEPRPTTLAGSDLVEAVGRLRRAEKDPERSAAILRDDLRRTLSRRLGVPADTSVDDLVAVAALTGADPDRLRAALEGRADDDDALVTLARTIAQTRQEILHEQH